MLHCNSKLRRPGQMKRRRWWWIKRIMFYFYCGKSKLSEPIIAIFMWREDHLIDFTLSELLNALNNVYTDSSFFIIIIFPVLPFWSILCLLNYFTPPLFHYYMWIFTNKQQTTENMLVLNVLSPKVLNNVLLLLCIDRTKLIKESHSCCYYYSIWYTEN